jgi:predicted DNA-binding transcriptional regulator YafY
VLKGSALFDEIDVVLREVAQLAHRPSTRPGVRGEAPSDGRLEDRFAYVPPMPRAYADRTEDVDEVFRAVAEMRVLRFRYREGEATAGSGRDGKEAREARGARYTAHPYALVLHAGTIACISHDVGRGTAHVFAFERMSDVEASESERYELPEDFAITDWLQGDFGVARAPRALRLLVEFDARVAEAVRARRVHPSQKVAVAQDGRVRASLAVPDCAEVVDRVRAWILGFGAAARVLEPRELADEIARELRRAAGRYAT